ncbi:MAG: MIP family channel protein [Betaproteobacteria bacterium]|nr:MIP family channel protein [Betaproteobacteria bacterium]
MANAVAIQELSSSAAWRATLAEFIATGLFVFLGAGTVVVTGGMLQEGLTSARLLAIAIAHGLAIFLLVSATAKVSGGHINPAVTFGAWITGKISLTKGVMYVVGQLMGAVVGALLIAAVIPDAAHGNLGAHGLGSGVTVGGGVLAEIVLTFALVFVVFATAMDPKGLAHIAPLAIGLTVLADHLFGVPVTGASMNPARSFGPALVAGAWADHWIFWVGPLLGGALAAVVYEFMFLRRED